MSERRGDQGFSVAPQRIGGGGPGAPGGRRRRIGVVVVLVAAVAVLAVSWLGPRLTQAPNFQVSYFATPSPGATPSPTATPADVPPGFETPLPEVTRPDGPIPTGRLATLSDRLRIVDLATGTVVTGPPAVAGRDAVFRNQRGDGWTCVCFDDGETTAEESRRLRIDAIDGAGAVTSTQLATYPRPRTPDNTTDVQTDVDLVTSGGHHHGLVAVASRNGGPYHFSITPIDVDGRTLGSSVELGTSAALPRPSASPLIEGGLEIYTDGPHLRLSPDGRVAFVWASIQQTDGNGGDSTELLAWRAELGADGSIGKVGVAHGLLQLPSFCPSIGFATLDRLSWVCPRFDSEPGGGSWAVGTVALDGETVSQNSLAAVGANNWGIEPLFDRANDQIYAWDPGSLTIFRIDARTLVVTSQRFDPLVQTAPGQAPGGGAAPVMWRRADSAIAAYPGTLAGSLDGERLYALGLDPEAAPDTGYPPSRGLFVIDRRTLALVDRWAPAADYLGVTALPGGYVAAGGVPGVSENGRGAPWEASLTIHDAADGRILVRFGRLGDLGPPTVVDR